MWACLWFIVANAIAQAIHESQWVLAVFELAIFPATFFIYPWVADADASAWPLGDASLFIPAFIVAVIAYPISTFVGGLDPVG